MMVPIRYSLSDLASSDIGEDGEDADDEETEPGKLSEDDEPCWLMGTISKTVQQHMERFRQKKMMLDNVTPPVWGDAAKSFHWTDRKYGTTEVRVPAVIKPPTNDDAAAPAPASFRELMECLDIFPGISQILQGTSRSWSCHIRLGSGEPESNTGIAGLAPAMGPDASHILKAKSVEPASFYHSRLPHQLITV